MVTAHRYEATAARVPGNKTWLTEFQLAYMDNQALNTGGLYFLEENAPGGRFLTHTMWEMQPARQDVAVLAVRGVVRYQNPGLFAAALAPAKARRSQTRCSSQMNGSETFPVHLPPAALSSEIQ